MLRKSQVLIRFDASDAEFKLVRAELEREEVQVSLRPRSSLVSGLTSTICSHASTANAFIDVVAAFTFTCPLWIAAFGPELHGLACSLQRDGRYMTRNGKPGSGNIALL